MARGNDGNLMQHAIEAMLISQLANGRGLYLLATHSMAPFEPLNARADENAQRRARFDHWWDRAQGEQEVGEPSVLHAYRGTRRRVPELYPNTAEIAAELVGRENLQGSLIEVCPAKCRQLEQAWAGAEVTILEGSWRCKLMDSLPQALERPWLLSLDPMIYVAEHNRDDDQFHPDDFGLLAAALETLCATQRPGAMVLSCYSMIPSVQDAFRMATGEIVADLEQNDMLHLRFAHVAFGGSAHVAAIAATDEDLADQACESWMILRNHPLDD
ncbi:hypothetical protein LCGC14_1032870 [marine sediment metagenome]|uniref:Uncharacterized protein n=1 Tax=marine sediment metagenome TaxID=412755 RepID=A0A0F9R062_9ZZZZ